VPGRAAGTYYTAGHFFVRRDRAKGIKFFRESIGIMPSSGAILALAEALVEAGEIAEAKALIADVSPVGPWEVKTANRLRLILA
jgi:hypothetical protein